MLLLNNNIRTCRDNLSPMVTGSEQMVSGLKGFTASDSYDQCFLAFDIIQWVFSGYSGYSIM